MRKSMQRRNLAVFQEKKFQPATFWLHIAQLTATLSTKSLNPGDLIRKPDNGQNHS